jgi:DNA-binding transcriptional LysR family regulator
MNNQFNRIPPLHLLIAFEAIARHSSFARASEELALTPSAISHRIKNLEELWNIELFSRNANQLKLTTAGARYLREVKESLISLSTLARPDFITKKTRLRIATPPTFGRQHLLPKLSDFTSLHPEIDIELHVQIPLVDVNAEEVDIEIRFGDGKYPGYEVSTLIEEPSVPACSRNYFHKIGGSSAFNPIEKPDDLKELVLLRSPLSPWKPWFVAAGLDWKEPNIGPQFNDLGLVIEAIIADMGVGLVRPRMVRPLMATGQIIKLTDIESASPYNYYIVKNPNKNTPEIKAFTDWLNLQQW